jgi:hypothetical protein
MNLGQLSKPQRAWARELSDAKRKAYFAERDRGASHADARAAIERPRKRRTSAAPGTPERAPKRFSVASDASADGSFTCRTCGTDRPVTAFPTINNPDAERGDTRGTECRSCRDNGHTAVAA